MFFVTDTHSFIWYMAEDKRLGKLAEEKFNLAEKGKAIILIPTIVLAEILYILEKKNYNMKFRDIINKIEFSWNFKIMPLDLRIIKEIVNLRKLNDLHDRIIVASALVMNAGLITKDESIKRSRYVEVIW